MNYKYIILPVVVWAVSQTFKFILTISRHNSSIKFKNIFQTFIREGGMPSTHTAILTSSLYLVWSNYRFSALFMFCLVLTIILLYNMALERRRQEMLHSYFNNVQELKKIISDGFLLDSAGHTWKEIVWGALLGLVLGFVAVHIIS
jgi:acid phosphatase family membrane protein YuiD